MPQAPGSYVTVTSAAPSPGVAARTGTWFVTGECQQGLTGVAIPLTSMNDFANFCGARPGYTMLYDALDEFFHDGGQLAYLSRVVGPSAVAATHTLVDRAGSPLSTLSVTAAGGGVWGNSCTVAVANGTPSNSYVLTLVNPLTGQTWTSPPLFSPADAVTWATNEAGTAPWAFPFVIANLGSATSSPNNNPAVVAATALASGADDLADVVEAQWTAALTAFPPTLGPGQVSAPGHNTAAGYQALNAHASAVDAYGALINNRFALLDDVDSSTAANVVANAVSAQISPVDNGFAQIFGPWVIIPGVPASAIGASPAAATRTVPPSALAAALCAVNDQANDSGVAVAGPNGTSSYAIGVTQTYSESDRGTLNAAGVTVIRYLNNAVQIYGDVTVATNPTWGAASNSRLRMELVDQVNTTAQAFAFARMDGQGHMFSHAAGSVGGVLSPYWVAGALYGATAAQAYQVNVASVNTPTTEAAGAFNISVAVRMSKNAPFVNIGIVSYPITSSLPA